MTFWTWLKSKFGGGSIPLSDAAAARHKAAESAAAHVWELSERERGIVMALRD